MKIRLFSIILFLTSFIYGQTTVFVKYNSLEKVQSEITRIEQKFYNNSVQKTNSDFQNTPKITSFKNSVLKLNNDLKKIVKIDFFDEASAEKFLLDATNDPNIEYVQKNGSYKIDYIPEDSLYSDQWGLKNIRAEEAWDILSDDLDEIILAVIDTGVDIEHPDIDDVLFQNEGEIGKDINGNDKRNNGIDDDQNGFIDDFQGWDFVNKLNIFPIDSNEYDFSDWDNFPMDENGHGTNVSGIIGAEHNSFGIAGVNPKVKILNLRAFDKNGNGEEDDAAAAIIYAVNMGAKIINMSWGDSQYSKLLKDVVKYAYENDVILIGSSGNSGSNKPHYPSGFSEVISVGAIQENEELAGFSNYGSTIDLVAPGSQILTLGRNNSYKKVSGTSVSAPFVSAAASLIYALNDKFSPEEIKQILKTTSKDLGESDWDERFGSGSLNLYKALKLLNPSIIKFNHPTQDFYTLDDSLRINISCLSPYFKDYKIYYGIGINPESWNYLQTNNENYQKFREDVIELNISEFQDTSYTLRILMNRIDGSTQEERINFYIDRTPPEVMNYNIFPAMLNDLETVQASIISNEPTIAKLHYRKANYNGEFNYLLLDGFIGDQGIISQKHFGILPPKEVQEGIEHEFYFELTNNVGLSTIIKDENNKYFKALNSTSQNIITSNIKNYSLPNGRIYNAPVVFNGIENNHIVINENETSANISIYNLGLDGFTKVKSLPNKIPISIGDFNGDTKTDFLNLYVKNGFIDSQSEVGELEFVNNFSDSSGTFWPSYAADIDEDGNTEIIAFTNDTTISIWEVSENFSLTKEAELNNFVTSGTSEKSIFRNNITLVDNFDEDEYSEIVTIDNYGRLVIYQINGNSNYTNEKIVEHFYPLEANSTIAKGDYNGDGKIDIGIILNFEENIFTTPLIYCSVFSLYNDSISYFFQNMFITTENNYVNRFEKQYNAIRFSDVDNNGKEDLIIFNYPNSYIYEFVNNEKNNLVFYQSDVNSQSIFIGDLDNNGINELGIPNGERLFFHEFIENEMISPPIITDYYSSNSNQIYFEWLNKENLDVYVYKKDANNNYIKYDSLNGNSYTDIGINGEITSYYLKFYNSDSIISNKSKIIDIYVHAPTVLKNHNVLSNKQLKLFFSEKIATKAIRLNQIKANNNIKISSISPSSEISLLINFEKELQNGMYSISLNGLRDFYNSPIIDTTINFEVASMPDLKNHLLISSYKILNNNTLEVIFNYNLDEITSLKKSNYIFTPNNKLQYLSIDKNEKNKILLKTKNPFGAIGKEYVLKIKNIFSSKESGSFPISEVTGSEIVLTSNAENLDDIYVYPNPLNRNDNNYITFANLPSKVEIYIFSIDGKFINKIIEDDGNGGVDWNLRNENGKIISSGIYFYKAISLDNFNKTLQEKIGKFAIIK